MAVQPAVVDLGPFHTCRKMHDPAPETGVAPSTLRTRVYAIRFGILLRCGRPRRASRSRIS